MVVVVITSQPALAATDQGFMTGGGVGSVSCPDFVDAMALARQRGGIKSPGGVQVVHQFIQYVLGFRTGFNMAWPGVYDAFAPMGNEDVGNKSIVYIESWCANHPASGFDDGIFELLKTLKTNAQGN